MLNRPFIAYLRTSNCSTAFDFDTFEDAREYLAQQVLRVPQFQWTTGRETMNFQGTYLEVRATGRTYDLCDLGLAYERGHEMADVEKVAHIARAAHYGIDPATGRKPWLG